MRRPAPPVKEIIWGNFAERVEGGAGRFRYQQVNGPSLFASTPTNPMKRLFLCLLLCAAPVLGAAVKFDIPAQRTPDALMAFAKQADAKVLFSHNELKGSQSPAVAGELEPLDALGKLLAGTGYTAQAQGEKRFLVARAAAVTGTVRGTLIGSDGRQAEGVTVRLRDTQLSVLTDRNGDYALLEVPAGSHIIVATAEGYQPLHITEVKVRGGREMIIGRQLLRRHSAADGTTKMEPFVVVADSVTEMDPFEVSGAKVKPFLTANVDLPRTVDDAKAYYMFEASVIEQSGANTVEDFLSKKLPMISSFTSGSKQSASSITPYLGTTSVVSLRGLSSTQTLILMNGRRLPAVMNVSTETSPDLNSIPMSIVDRIEVLPSSGSGIYGGGAVGGVINIVTKRNYSGGELKLTYDNSFDSDSAKRRIDLTYGLTLEGGRTNVMLFGSQADANFLSPQDRYSLVRRNVARVAANNPAFFTGNNTLLGTTPRIDSVNGVPLVLKTGQSLGTSFVFVPAGYRGFRADGSVGLIANVGVIDTEWPDTEQWYNGRRYSIYSLPETRSVRAEIRRQMLPTLEMFVNFSYDQNASKNVVSNFALSSQVGLTVPAAAPTNPFNQPVVVRFPSNSAAQPYQTTQTRRQAVGGFSLKLPHEWQVLGDYSWNTSATALRQTALAGFPPVTAPVAAGTLDPFIDLLRNPQSDTLGDYYGWNNGYSSGRLREASLRAAGPLPTVFSVQPSLALSAQSRHEQRLGQHVYSFFPDAPDTASANLGGAQRVDAYYAELTLPLISRDRARPGLRLLEVQVAGRRDEYTTSTQRVKGTTSTTFTPPTLPAIDDPKVNYRSTNPVYGVRYKPVEDIALRASYSTGFLPPTATQLLPGIPATTGSNVIDPLRGGSTISVIANPVGGNPNLTPETSKNWSAGVVFTPQALSGLRLALDYTFIKKQNNISSLSAQVIVNNEALFPGRVTRGPVPAGSPFSVGPITGVDTTALNLFSTAVEAYDLSINYQKTTATWGTFGFDALGTVTQHYLQRIALRAPLLEYVGTPSAGGPLKLRGNLGVTWSRGPWQAGWSASYYDRYKVSAAPFTTSVTNVLNNGGPTVPSQIYHDVFARYRFGAAEPGGAKWRTLLNRTELLVGVKNVFNKAPAFDGTSLSAFFFSPYGDARLASYYLSLKRAF